MRFSPILLLLLSGLAAAQVHHMFVGGFSAANLYSISYDTTTQSLSIANNMSMSAYASAGHLWLALSHDKKNVYGAAGPVWTSYSVTNSTSLTFENSVSLSGNCSSTRAIFLLSSPQAPYNVYGTPFGNCGNVLTVDDSGTLSAVTQNYSYATNSGVHGLALSPDSSTLYSADDNGNAVWTHAISPSSGELTLLGTTPGPTTGSDPRHVEVHPDGGYIYVVLEGANSVISYALDPSTRLPLSSDVTYPLIPDGLADSDYWSDEVKLSTSSRYLWATSRARSSSNVGYVSAFSLAADGKIEKQLFLVPTTTSGGAANAVMPSTWEDGLVALTDSSVGFVEMWRILANETGVERVAKLQVETGSGGCCANAVWVD